ncbi:hypothetical protein GOP47_0014159 [Adiantum capillus-veneris]|uniref:Uncharacterized protein n=1 Tax=Adiantum capillus-veneris TaxID=13818 RepID=A0A9D4UPW7_ADICA|nr:hypothetical protein GOP47_0014159 [Adiantum capillus-veneris]
MTIGLSCAAASPSCPPISFIACNNEPSRPSRKLISHSATERPPRPLLVCSRPTVLATCSTISAEERLVGNVDGCSGLKVEQGSIEEDLRLEDLRLGRLYKGKVFVVESYGVCVCGHWRTCRWICPYISKAGQILGEERGGCHASRTRCDSSDCGHAPSC